VGKAQPSVSLSAAANSPAATGVRPHSDQRETAGYTSTQDWSRYQGAQMSEAEARRAASRGVGARQIVGEVMTEFGQTTTGAMSGGVLDYYARGGKGTKTPFYDQNVYSAPGSYTASPAPPDNISGQAPGWMSDLRPAWAQKQAAGASKDKLGDAFAKVKAVFLSRGAISSGRAMWRVIRQFDYDNSGAIDIFELQKGMQTFGVALDKAELLSVMDAFDKDGNRRVDLAEFMVAIRGNLNKSRQKAVEIAFQEMDGDHSGEISLAEINACYDPRTHPQVVAGKMTRDEAHAEFISAMDKDADGVITKSEFLDFFKDISLAFEADEDFTRFVRGMWRKRR